jgi:hypothetical protein
MVQALDGATPSAVLSVGAAMTFSFLGRPKAPPSGRAFAWLGPALQLPHAFAKV